MKSTHYVRHALLITSFAAMSSAIAQPPEAPCVKLLPAEKLKAAAGAGFVEAESRIVHSGELLCAWMRRGAGGFATVAVQYYDKNNIAGSDKKGTADALYENIIKPHEEMSKAKREPIAGVGKRAALVPADPQRLVAIQRDDAVLRIVMNGVTKPQAIAIAKAVATP
jgi:hypothetical protein